MDVEFYSNDPRRKSRTKLDAILRNGVDQLAIACAFCNRAGIAILKRHTFRLKRNESFVVVSVAPPTDYKALAKLHREIPNNLYVHWGALSPVEIKGGAALMHSKVFYARAGNECWLWTGSHNLTANATQGGNCEAAVILHGTADEEPFVAAMQHLLACKNEATLYDPETPPPSSAERTDICAIHAEVDSVPSNRLPWHVHLCLESSEFDNLLRPPAGVRLFLYAKGSLIHGWQFASPIAAFAGSLTGQNLTARNPNAIGAGILAEWRAANFGIRELNGIPILGAPVPPGPHVTTQVVLHIDRESDRTEALFSEKPQLEAKLIHGQMRLSDVDPDMRRFFRKESLEGSSLVHVPLIGRKFVLSLPEIDTRRSDLESIRDEFFGDNQLPLELSKSTVAMMEKRHPFIVRAKYRVRGKRR